MTEPNCEYMCSTNVQDEQDGHLSRYSPEIGSGPSSVPYVHIQMAAVQHSNITSYDDDLAETRSAPSWVHRRRAISAEHVIMSRSRSGDNLNLQASPHRQSQPPIEFRDYTNGDAAHPASSDRADDVEEAIYQRFTLSHVPSWGDTTYQDDSTTDQRTLVEVTSDEKLIVTDKKTSCGGEGPLSVPAIEAYASNPLKHDIATRIFQLFTPSPSATRTDQALSTHLQAKSQSSQSTCAFCGSDFTGPDHKQKSIDHIRATHFHDRSIFTAVKCLDRHPMRLSKLPESVPTEEKKSTLLQPEIPPSQEVVAWRIDHRLRLADDLTAIGTKWQDELHARRRATRHIPGGTQSAYEHDPKALLDMILALVNSSNPGVNPETLNDLFNGLDLVVEDLLHRRPKNAIVRGIAETFATLRHVSGPDTRSYSSHAAPRHTAVTTGLKSCPKSQHTDSSPSSGSASFSTSCGQASTRLTQGNAIAHGFTSPEGIAGPIPVTFVNGRRKKSRTRHLACPFTKHDEVHGRQPTCRFPGAANMSGLRAHLTSGEHLIFMTYCQACADYVFDRHEWEDHHQHVGGSNRQIRGNGVLNQWRGMYKKKFPHSERIPHPHIGNLEWIANDALLQREDNHFTAIDHNHSFNFNNPPTRTPPQIEIAPVSPNVAMTADNTFSGHANMAVHMTRIPEDEMLFIHGQGGYTGRGNPFPSTSQAFLDDSLAAADALLPAASPVPYALDMYLNNTQYGATRSEHFSHLNQASSVYSNYGPHQRPGRLAPTPRTMASSPYADPEPSRRQEDATDYVGTATLSRILDLLRCCAHALNTGDIAHLTQMIIEAHSSDSGQMALLGDALVMLISQTEQRQRRAASYTRQHADGTVNPRDVETDSIIEDGRQSSDPNLFQEQALRSLESWEDELVAPITMGDTRPWVPPATYPSAIFPDISVSIG